MALGAMAMQTLEATDGPIVVGLEVGASTVDSTRVRIYPRTGHIVFAVTDPTAPHEEVWKGRPGGLGVFLATVGKLESAINR